jgi:hypothetical protein
VPPDENKRRSYRSVMSSSRLLLTTFVALKEEQEFWFAYDDSASTLRQETITLPLG